MKHIFILTLLGLASTVTFAQNWLTTGNTGTNPSTNFIGTKDNVSFVLRTNNVERGRILNTGQWRFGTTADYAQVDALGKLSFVGAGGYLVGGNKYAFQYSGNTNFGLFFNSTNVQYEFRNGSATPVFYVNANNGNTVVNGSLGVGTSTPSSKLSVLGSSYAFQVTDGSIDIRTFTGATYGQIGTYNNYPFQLMANNGVDQLVLLPNGNVGIGNPTPAAKLDVTGDALINGLTAGRGAGNVDGNTALGKAALSDNTTGFNNTCIGNNAYPVSGTVSNYTGIGFNVGSISSASNMVELGDFNVTVIRGEVNFSTYSDERIKKNIKNNVPGLSFINLLKPVTYNIDIDKQVAMTYKDKKAAGNEQAGKSEISKQLKTGFLAQEVEAAAKKVNYDFSGIVKPQNANDLYSLRYSEFVVPLVQAVQELSKKNDEKDAAVANLQKQIDDLKAMLSSNQSNSGNSSQLNKQNVVLGMAASLSQNTPNPFTNSTIINYYLPVNNGNAYINFYNESGAVLKSTKLSGNGNGSISLKANDLIAGTYRYSLIIDGKVIESRQMVSTK